MSVGTKEHRPGKHNRTVTNLPRFSQLSLLVRTSICALTVTTDARRFEKVTGEYRPARMTYKRIAAKRSMVATNTTQSHQLVITAGTVSPCYLSHAAVPTTRASLITIRLNRMTITAMLQVHFPSRLFFCFFTLI